MHGEIMHDDVMAFQRSAKTSARKNVYDYLKVRDAFECIFLFNNELSPLFVDIDLCASTKICLLECVANSTFTQFSN